MIGWSAHGWCKGHFPTMALVGRLAPGPRMHFPSRGLNSGLQGTSRGLGGLQGTSRGLGGLQGTSRGLGGLQGTSRGLNSGLQGTSRGLNSGLQGTSRGLGGLQGTSRGLNSGLQGTRTAQAPPPIVHTTPVPTGSAWRKRLYTTFPPHLPLQKQKISF